MIDRFSVHAADKRHVVDDFLRPRQKFRDPHTTLARLFEFELRRCNRKASLPRGHRRKSLTVPHGLRKILIVPRIQLWLVVIEVQLRWTTDHMQINDVL